ncbi:MAG: aminotransferase class V-fold PLP-dependent enzyme [Pseudomonadota bacterium]
MPDISPVYMDYAATTPVADEVTTAMVACLTDPRAFANPSSSHAFGGAAQDVVDRAANHLSSALGAMPEEIVWTSGATESDNLAIIGAARYRANRGRHIITSLVEHKAVIDACRQLEREGFEISWLSPGRDGQVTVAQVISALRDDTQLVSLMWVNNETGVINDIPALAAAMHEHPAMLHVDAAQAFGKLPIDLAAVPIDLLSVTAHKCYGPKGVGALYLAARHGVQVEPLLFGGGQQRGLRPGTLAPHQIAGFGAAAALVEARLDDDMQSMASMGRRLEQQLLSIDGVSLNANAADRLPSLINVSVAGVAGETLVAAMRPVALATGSACNSAVREPSFVLRALGLDDRLAAASLRFSIGRMTTADEVDLVADRFRDAVDMARRIAGELGQVPPG